jgi:hypothetical protein
MATNGRKKITSKKKPDRMARMIGAMLRKLEVNPNMRYETVLTVEEHNEAVQMMRAAVAHVLRHVAAQHHKGKRPRPPARFQWRGFWYPLQYSNMGRVFIATKSGARVLGSGYFAI